ncbi:hypothetical protein QTO34_017140 [Cnephaeus nilssonii]|uniref:Platelet-derived growth factor receptor-like protein n=1 Tax=Cnephaeus nilssonii TaxID=3371016 RepID=A0AA40I0G5_CNENI|nr:hypothetical protein QTO34_017140 [Eptesicus nilssonii]
MRFEQLVLATPLPDEGLPYVSSEYLPSYVSGTVNQILTPAPGSSDNVDDIFWHPLQMGPEGGLLSLLGFSLPPMQAQAQGMSSLVFHLQVLGQELAHLCGARDPETAWCGNHPCPPGAGLHRCRAALCTLLAALLNAFLTARLTPEVHQQREPLQRNSIEIEEFIIQCVAREVNCQFSVNTSRPFLEMHSEIPEMIYMTEGRALVIPCRVTSPNITVTLKKVPFQTLIPDGKRIIWDSRKGFLISNATYKEIGLLTCEATVNGHLYQTNYLTFRQTTTILDVQMSTPSPVKLLRGQTLTLNCTVTTPFNTRVQMNWTYPGETNKSASIRRRFYQSNSHDNIFYSVLTINKVQSKDKGIYTCHVTSGSSFKSVNTSVRVYDEPFITVKHRKQQVLETVAGKKSYRLSMKVRAFPPPEVAWLKDGLPVTEKSARYFVHGYSLIIKDVAAEDTGNYIILLSINQSNVFKNLTATLIVNVKPQIYEKAVSPFPEPILYPLGSRQILTCTIYGIPQPTIKWLWHPCNHNHSKASYTMLAQRGLEALNGNLGSVGALEGVLTGQRAQEGKLSGRLVMTGQQAVCAQELMDGDEAGTCATGT